MISLPNIISFIIYLVIGAAVVIALMVIFRKMGISNTAELIADSQMLSGMILVGDNSTLTMTLQNGSSFQGSISGEIENAKGKLISSEVGTVNVILDETSTWTLTDDTYISSFEGSVENVISNGYTLYVSGVAVN